MINYMSADLEKEKVATFMKRNYSFAHIDVEKYKNTSTLLNT